MAVTINGTTGIETNTDTGKIKVGIDDDLIIEHNGSHSYIKQDGTGWLVLSSDNVQIANKANTEAHANFNNNGSVELFHNGTKQCETSANGLAFPSGKGIDFSATSGTGDSEILKDYEEGTFDATMANSVTLHSNYNNCSYIKIGDLVHVCGEFRIDADNSNSAVKINNLPFGCHANTEGNNYSLGSVGLYSYTMNSGYTWCICKTSPGSSTLHFQVMRQSGNDSASLEAIGDGYISFGITYKAA